MVSPASILPQGFELRPERLDIAAFGDRRQLRRFHLEGHHDFLEFLRLRPDFLFGAGYAEIGPFGEYMVGDLGQIRQGAGVDLQIVGKINLTLENPGYGAEMGAVGFHHRLPVLDDAFLLGHCRKGDQPEDGPGQDENQGGGFVYGFVHKNHRSKF